MFFFLFQATVNCHTASNKGCLILKDRCFYLCFHNVFNKVFYFAGVCIQFIE